MAYGDFKTLNQALTEFKLTLINQPRLFQSIPSIAPSSKLQSRLEEGIDLALAISTEKAQSELIIAPILLEIRAIAQPHASLFSGVSLNADPPAGLVGECDFILSKSSNQLEVTAPIAVLVEAKNNDIKSGLGQCVAQMVGAQRFNTDQSVTIIGAVTTGVLWRFLRLNAQTLEVDLTEYTVPSQIETVLGVLKSPF
ncbi:hypothetical protein [Leptolyngbya sp. NIES-2104]|uniref:hypothetical protein n=1 Tax=Leptolyngbya sp. NIES-2104 TaxID=1552121 RepID=UPI0006EC94F8|nr:hypothetical protein [Leptolyngbya sp. NIES-2104]GAP95025.1 hypothetical protein NIES2104_15450 [Leptolyngbya sp. NIES-2104]